MHILKSPLLWKICASFLVVGACISTHIYIGNKEKEYITLQTGNQISYLNKKKFDAKWEQMHSHLNKKGFLEALSHKDSFINNIKPIFQQAKDSITFPACTIDFANIPFLTDDEQFNSCIKDIPSNTDKTKYWMELDKDNEKGSITLNVFGKSYSFHKKENVLLTHTQLLTSKVFEGFPTMSIKDILAERTVRVFKNLFGFESNIDQINASGLNQISPETHLYAPTGTGVVIDKHPNKPLYYIATNKHVVLSDIKAEEANKNPFLKKIGNTRQGKHVYIHVFDYLAHQKQTNLVNYITFGQHYEQPSIGELNDIDLPQTELEKISKYKQQTFNFSQGEQNIVKQITLVKDFSNVFYKQGNQNKHIFQALNPQYKDLTDSDVNLSEKITADMVIFALEFTSDTVDPFKDWWSKRPTKIRKLNEQDFFRSNLARKGDASQPLKVDSLMNPSEPANEEDEDTVKVIEIGSKKQTEVISSYFQSKDHPCSKEGETNLEHGIVKGLIYTTPYLINNNQNSNEYGQNIINSQMFFATAKEQPTSGSSGSPIFDKNLNLIGLNWGGNEALNLEECEAQNNWWYNIFTWFGVDENINTNGINRELWKSMTLDDQQFLRPYKYY